MLYNQLFYGKSFLFTKLLLPLQMIKSKIWLYFNLY